MNNSTTTTIIGWETRNYYKRNRAKTWCQNYGLQPLLKNVFIGKLYVKEKRMLSALFEELFTKKTDTFLITSLCNSCHNSLTPMIQQKTVDSPPFEIVNLP